MTLSFDRTAFVQAAVVTVVTVAALGLLGFVGAYRTWQWFAPRAEPSQQSQPEPASQPVAALGLFGSVPREANVSIPTGTAIRLLGVVAAVEGREAFAIVVLDGKQIVAARKGSEIAPGLMLADVAADHVELERNGARESLAWPEKAQPDAAARKINR